MAMSGMGMMAGMAAGQALIQSLLGGRSGAQAGFFDGMMGGMGGYGASMRGGAFRAQQAFPQGMARRQAAQPQRQMPAPAPAAFALVSRLPGRRRYRAAGLGAELAELLQQKLAQLPFLRGASVNAATGSLLFTYAPADEARMDELADFLQGHIFSQDAEPSGLEAEAALLTRSIRGTVRDFSGWLRRASGGWLDVSSAASLLFLFSGLQKMITGRQLPSGSQLFWWAVSLLRGWKNA